MIELIVDDAKDRMEKSVSSTHQELGTVRTGRATPSLLDSVKVDYYGSMMPLKQVANIAVPEPRMLTVHPWDRSMLAPIEKAILKADIGITPNNDGHIIRLPIPALTEERRKEMVKLVHKLGEDGRIAIRNVRRDALNALKKAQKDKEISEDEESNAGIDIQELTDSYVQKIDDMIKAKEKEVMEV
ncbi:ribosome recycling factor [bacterium]|nr:ribosome recycling factor [bacterium]